MLTLCRSRSRFAPKGAGSSAGASLATAALGCWALRAVVAGVLGRLTVLKDQKSFTVSLTWWLWRGGCTRSHSELGRETPQRRWYSVSRRGRVGRCQVCQAVKDCRPDSQLLLFRWVSSKRRPGNRTAFLRWRTALATLAQPSACGSLVERPLHEPLGVRALQRTRLGRQLTLDKASEQRRAIGDRRVIKGKRPLRTAVEADCARGSDRVAWCPYARG